MLMINQKTDLLKPHRFFLCLDLHSTVKRRFAETYYTMSKIYFCDWAVVQLQSIGRSVRAARLEISSSTNQSLCGQRLRATCTAAELQPPSLRSKTPLQMRERRGSDTNAYQGELTGWERWTGACKGGRKTLKKRENLTTPTDIKLRKTLQTYRVDAVWPWHKELMTRSDGLVSLCH